MKAIVHVPNAILTTPAQPITSFNKKLATLIEDLKKTLAATRNPKGVGLAAPQIGEPYRAFVTRPNAKEPMRAFINPMIQVHSKDNTEGVPERDNKLEGCLSIPNIWGKVNRSKSITLTWQDESGTSHTEVFSGFLATIIQHETDHVNGILFTHRVLEQKGKFYESRKDREGKDTLDEIELT